MDINKVAPELRRVYQYLPAIPFHHPSLRWLMRFTARTFTRGGRARGVRSEEVRVGPARFQVYHPPQASGAGLLWTHGGGFMVGSAAQDRGLCARFARELGLLVVSVDYRLAPENPFPAPLDDCVAAWNWLVEAAPGLGLDPRRLAVGGMSAGGGLAASLCQRVLDSGGPQPAAQLLIYPMLDDRTAANRDLDHINHYLWNNHNNRAGWTAYLGREPGAPDVPRYAAAARRADLTGLPPAWIGVGDIDLFFEEDREYAERLRAAGVDCEFLAVPMAPHGFQVAVPRSGMAGDFNHEVFGFLARILDL